MLLRRSGKAIWAEYGEWAVSLEANRSRTVYAHGLPSGPVSCGGTCADYTADTCWPFCTDRSFVAKAAVRERREANLAAYRADPKAYFAASSALIQKYEILFMLWFSGGDIVDSSYAAGMVKLALAHPQTRFLAFTKKPQLLHGVLLPMNLTVVLSMWPGIQYDPLDVRRFRRAYLSIDPRVTDGALQCPGACEECGLCWELPRIGADVVFPLVGRESRKPLRVVEESDSDGVDVETTDEEEDNRPATKPLPEDEIADPPVAAGHESHPSSRTSGGKADITEEFLGRLAEMEEDFACGHGFLRDLADERFDGFRLSTVKNAHLYYKGDFYIYIKPGKTILDLISRPNANIWAEAEDKSELLFGSAKERDRGPHPLRELIGELGGFNLTDPWANHRWLAATPKLGPGYVVTLANNTPPLFFGRLLERIREVHMRLMLLSR